MATKPETVIGLTKAQKAELRTALLRAGTPSAYAMPVPIQTDPPAKPAEEPAKENIEVLCISF